MAPGYSLSPDGGELRAAVEQGRVSALAVECHRELQGCMDTYPDLFPAGPFDTRLLNGVALANAFGSPWATAEGLRMALLTSMWNFAADWLVDYVAETREEVEDLILRCLAVADGTSDGEDSSITRFLAHIVNELDTVPAFSEKRSFWCDQLERWLRAMAREWDWKAALSAGDHRATPTFEEYLGNADNFGTTWVNLAHWIHTGDAATLDHLEELWEASQEVQRVLRLLNDLATHHRDLSWGDLNALMLGVDRAGVVARIDELVDGARALIKPLTDACPWPAAYLERQIGFSTGFYGATDYWGELR
ncbi:terpene synthase family protein [Actinomadura rugatobispora]|uniref:Terpene synthase family protein n=1 Tax=Actinomadura rugatobispora TaxID=1994 RepID=A0ABW1A9K0_9ACTN|nr:hypothetical protein GCM10010200_053490 [Actinomadura rugatobispora]